MVIILVSYLVLVWLFFSKLKLLRLTWTSGGVAGLIAYVLLWIQSYVAYL